ncbi:MAG: Ppx/GppA phosphatase family protein [Hyphomonadaceae bacterium]
MANPTRARGGPARNRGGASRKYYAALDLGTNNCRLLIAEQARTGGIRVVESFSQIVRLGEGLASTGRLSEAAMARTRDALIKCADRINKYQPIRSRCIATQACRAASNGREFISDMRKACDLKLETISPKDEAKYALLGTLDLIDPSSDFALVIDIGGGSTELCWVDARVAVERGIAGCSKRAPILGWLSAPFGVVTLTESFANPAEGAYERMVAHVQSYLEQQDAATRFGPLFRAGRGHLIGNSGTVTSLAAVHAGLRKYQRSSVDGLWLSHEGALAVRNRLARATHEERAAEPCIGPDRADLIVAGCAILEAVWALWPSERMRVGDRGLREGILLSMMHTPPGEEQRRASRRNRRPRRRVRAAGAES